MSKKQNSSYEGFRRKNSLKLNEPSKINTVIEIHHSKIKKEDIRVVEDLSMQLQNISKRSLTSRSFGQNVMQHTKSCHSINFYNEDSVQELSFNKPKKQMNSLKRLSFEFENEQTEFSQLKRQKVGNLFGFNQFDIIEQTRSFCQQEIVQDISPVALKYSLHEPLSPKHQQLGKRNLKVVSSTKNIIKKPTIAKDEANPKKEKIAHDLNELDKMQKQLQSKKANRDNLGNKMLSNSTGTHKPKEVVNAQGLKDSIKLKLLVNKDVKNQATKSNHQKSSKTLMIPPKLIEPKLLKIQTKAKQQQMIATRMLSEKQKSSLVNRLQKLRQIIQKNQICSDSNDQITLHLNSIQKLLTH